MKALCMVALVWGLCGVASGADRLESDVLRTASGIGLPRKPELARKEVLKRRKYHLEELEREWKRTTKEVLKNTPAKEVNYKDSRARKAVVRFRSRGSWVYRAGSMHSADKVLLSVDRGVSECWVKHSLNKTYNLGYRISQSPVLPSTYYYSKGQEIRWRKCSWDARRNRWALITSDQRRKVERDYTSSLRQKLREAEEQARRGLEEIQLNHARSYAKRAASNSRKRDGGKENRFRIDSDVGMGYFRVVFAYDKAILAESIQTHRKKFRKIPWGK